MAHMLARRAFEGRLQPRLAAIALGLAALLGSAGQGLAQDWRSQPANTGPAPTTGDHGAPLDGLATAKQAAPLLTADATREEVMRWLADYAPSSRGKLAYVSGTEAFWIEHQDRDVKNPMHVVATIHAENFGNGDTDVRSVYEVTDFDCERQTEFHIYQRSYLGQDLSGDFRKESEILKRSKFISPSDQDYAHLHTVCQPVYDQVRKRTYAVTVPLR